MKSAAKSAGCISSLSSPRPGGAIAAIDRDVELSDQILRVMVTKADHLNAEEMAAVEPQPIIPREERNPWDRPQWEDRPSGPRRDRRDSRPSGRPGRRGIDRSNRQGLIRHCTLHSR